MSETKLYAKLRVKTGEYSQDGKTKNRYADVGVLFASEHFNNMFIQLDTLPINKDFDGRIFINPIEETDRQRTDRPHADKTASGDVILEDIDDKPIDLSEIPF